MSPLRRLGIDIDGVVADLHKPWIEWMNEWCGLQLTEFQYWDHPVAAGGKEVLKFLHPRIYDKDIVKPIPGSAAAVEMFRDMGYGITFISHCLNETENAKFGWLARWGFLKNGDAFISTADKACSPVDMLVDDHIVNVRSFKGVAVLLNQSHNRHETWPGLRIDHLADLYPYIR